MRRILALSALAVSMVGLSACSGGGGASTVPSANVQSAASSATVATDATTKKSYATTRKSYAVAKKSY